MLNEHSVTAITGVCGVSNYCIYLHFYAYIHPLATPSRINPDFHSSNRRRRILRTLSPAPHDRKRATIVNMLMALLAMRLLEVMFFVGLVGSAVVVLISFIEDGKELFGKDEVNE